MSRPEHARLPECLQCLALTKALSDVFLTDNKFNAFFDLGKGFVESYRLNAHFEAAGRPLFHIVNKSHSFLHSAREAFYVSPNLPGCWLGEDFVGRMHSISFGSKIQKLSTKLMPKYRALLHLSLQKVIGAHERPSTL